PGRCVRVLAGGSGIPVAGKILPANPKDAWPPPGVLCCRSCSRRYRPTGWWWCGPTAGWSRRGCVGKIRRGGGVGLGGPRAGLRRAKAGGTFRPDGWVRWYAFAALVPCVGRRLAATGQAYQTAAQPLVCPRRGVWDAGHDEPWLLRTDGPAPAAAPCG